MGGELGERLDPQIGDLAQQRAQLVGAQLVGGVAHPLASFDVEQGLDEAVHAVLAPELPLLHEPPDGGDEPEQDGQDHLAQVLGELDVGLG